MTATAEVLQAVANTVAPVLDADAGIAALTGHASPQCARLGSALDGIALPFLLYQTGPARSIGGLAGTYRCSLELFALAESPTEASDLLAAAQDALTPLTFAAHGLDAIPDDFEPADTEPLDDVDERFAAAFGVACSLSLRVFVA